MQIFEQKYTTKMIYLYTLQNTIFQRSLRGKAALVGYIVARGEVFSSCMCAGVRRCAHMHVTRTLYIYYSVNGSITNRASESVKKRTYNLPSLTYARKADISNTNTCGSTLDESTASIFWYNTTSS